MNTTISAAPFTAGQRVRWSGYVINEKRNRWLSCGRASEKSAAKDALDAANAARGTVVHCMTGQYAPWVVVVRLDGATSDHHSLPHLWEVAT